MIKRVNVRNCRPLLSKFRFDGKFGGFTMKRSFYFALNVELSIVKIRGVVSNPIMLIKAKPFIKKCRTRSCNGITISYIGVLRKFGPWM